jgi:serine/threonine-protein kinase RIO1
VRRFVQQEDYALALMQRAGLPSPQPYGVVELTPEREYLVVTAFLDGATEIGQAEVDDAIIDQGLQIIRSLWEAGLAHRDIKPANLLVRDGRLYLIDVFFTEVRPSPWRQGSIWPTCCWCSPPCGASPGRSTSGRFAGSA